MTYKGDIDELLSAYLDEQLGTRQQTEVKRLLKHDQEIVKRLQYLKNCRALLQALPTEQAPEDTLAQVQQKLTEHQSTDLSSRQYYDELEGKKHLRFRKYFARAAMAALAAGLIIVVYSILSPAENEKVIVSNDWFKDNEIETSVITDKVKPDTVIAAADTKTKEQVKPQRTFSGKLLLTTSEFNGVDAFIKKSLVDNGAILIELPIAANRKGLYTIRCSPMELSMVLADMSRIWEKFDSAKLIVDTETDEVITINNVVAQQVDQIAAEHDYNESIQIARNISAMNALSGSLTNSEFDFSNTHIIDSMPIPKPILTGPNKNTEQKTDTGQTLMVELIIEVTATE